MVKNIMSFCSVHGIGRFQYSGVNDIGEKIYSCAKCRFRNDGYIDCFVVPKNFRVEAVEVINKFLNRFFNYK